MGSGELVPPDYVKNLFLNYLLISKNTSVLAQAVQNNRFFRINLGRFWWGGTPKTTSKFLCLKYLLISIRTEALA